MVVYLSFSLTVNPVEVGETTAWFGNLNQDGVPLIGEIVDFYDVATQEKLGSLTTDDGGNFSVDVIAKETQIGSHDLVARVYTYNVWSAVVTMVVIPPIVEPPRKINPVAIAVALMAIRYVLDNL